MAAARFVLGGAVHGEWLRAAVIHNGDHAQFEIDHGNTPKEQHPDWPLPSFDARGWAKAGRAVRNPGLVCAALQ